MAQEALYRAWENLEQLEDPQRADRWLFSIAANLMRTKGRSPAAEPLRDEHHPICESAEEADYLPEGFRVRRHTSYSKKHITVFEKVEEI